MREGEEKRKEGGRERGKEGVGRRKEERSEGGREGREESREEERRKRKERKNRKNRKKMEGRREKEKTVFQSTVVDIYYYFLSVQCHALGCL